MSCIQGEKHKIDIDLKIQSAKIFFQSLLRAHLSSCEFFERLCLGSRGAVRTFLGLLSPYSSSAKKGQDFSHSLSCISKQGHVHITYDYIVFLTFTPGEWGTFICQISQKQTLPFVYLIVNQIKNQINKWTSNWLSWKCNIIHNCLYMNIIIYHTKYDTLWYPLLPSYVLPKSTLNQFSYLHHPTHWIVSSSPLSCSCEEVHTLHQITFTQDKVTSPDIRHSYGCWRATQLLHGVSSNSTGPNKSAVCECVDGISCFEKP